MVFDIAIHGDNCKNSGIMGYEMAKSMGIPTHRKMTMDFLKKCIDVKDKLSKFNLIEWIDKYLETICGFAKSKVKKNGLIYLNGMIRLVLNACDWKYQHKGTSIFKWKWFMKDVHSVIAKYLFKLTDHFGWDHISIVVFNFFADSNTAECSVELIIILPGF